MVPIISSKLMLSIHKLYVFTEVKIRIESVNIPEKDSSLVLGMTGFILGVNREEERFAQANLSSSLPCL